MIKLYANKARITMLGAPEMLTAGMQNAVQCAFTFSHEWEGLYKTAVFRCGNVSKDVLESAWKNGVCEIPAEVLQHSGRVVTVGVYGTDGKRVVLPTVWCSIGAVNPGADPSGDTSTDATLPVWAQLAKMAREPIYTEIRRGGQMGDAYSVAEHSENAANEPVAQASSPEFCYNLVTDPADLTEGKYILIVKAGGEYRGSAACYALKKTNDSLGCIAAYPADAFVGTGDMPENIQTSVNDIVWTLTGDYSSFTLSDGDNVLRAVGAKLIFNSSGAAAKWSAAYDSETGTFRFVQGSDYYLGLRDDLELSSATGNPVFSCNTSADTTSYQFYLYALDRCTVSWRVDPDSTIYNGSMRISAIVDGLNISNGSSVAKGNTVKFYGFEDRMSKLLVNGEDRTGDAGLDTYQFTIQEDTELIFTLDAYYANNLITISCHGLEPDEQYALHLYTVSRHNGRKYGRWRHPANFDAERDTCKIGYGHVDNGPPVPDWMPNDGWLQTEWPVTPGEDLVIDLRTWLLPMAKPDRNFRWCGVMGVNHGAKAPVLFQFRVVRLSDGAVGECRQTLAFGADGKDCCFAVSPTLGKICRMYTSIR